MARTHLTLQTSTLPLGKECVLVLQPTKATPCLCFTSYHAIDVWLLFPSLLCNSDMRCIYVVADPIELLSSTSSTLQLPLIYSRSNWESICYRNRFSTIPIGSLNLMNLALPRAFVSMSTTWSLVGTHCSWFAPRWMQSLMKWNLISIWFDL